MDLLKALQDCRQNPLNAGRLNVPNPYKEALPSVRVHSLGGGIPTCKSTFPLDGKKQLNCPT